jgi:hypothetical protein
MKPLLLLLLGVAAFSFSPCEARSHIGSDLNRQVVHHARKKALLHQTCRHCGKVNELYARDLDDHDGHWTCCRCGKRNP